MSSTYRVTTADIEATRLVFVMLKGAKRTRKVAIPIMDGMSWTAFVKQVKAKLHINGIESMRLVTSAKLVTELSQLQDIDQIEVTPTDGGAPDALALSTAAPSAPRLYTNGAQALSTPPASQPGHSDRKYIKRKGVASALRRWLQSWSPSGTLPITTRDTDGSGARRPRRRHRPARQRALFGVCAVVFALVVFMFYWRAFTGMKVAEDALSGAAGRSAGATAHGDQRHRVPASSVGTVSEHADAGVQKEVPRAKQGAHNGMNAAEDDPGDSASHDSKTEDAASERAPTLKVPGTMSTA